MMLMLGWWYSRGWLWAIQSVGGRLNTVGEVFAVRVLLRTWFAPWKQISSPSSFRNFFQAAIDNTVSRFIGAIVRSLILFGALLWAIVIVVFGIVFIVVWPLLPLAIVALPILTISGVTP